MPKYLNSPETPLFHKGSQLYGLVQARDGIRAKDRVLVVDCPVPLQMERLLARDGETPEGAKRMIAAQASRPERLQLADDIINNDSDRASLIAAVNRLDQHYRQLAGSGGWQARGPRLR